MATGTNLDIDPKNVITASPGIYIATFTEAPTADPKPAFPFAPGSTWTKLRSATDASKYQYKPKYTTLKNAGSRTDSGRKLTSYQLLLDIELQAADIDALHLAMPSTLKTTEDVGDDPTYDKLVFDFTQNEYFQMVWTFPSPADPDTLFFYWFPKVGSIGDATIDFSKGESKIPVSLQAFETNFAITDNNVTTTYHYEAVEVYENIVVPS